MSDSETAAAPESGIDTDPEIEALLQFDPVPRRYKAAGGWTPDLQRQFIARLAVHGSPGKACEEMCKDRGGVAKLYKSPEGASFRAAWDAAVELATRRWAERIPADQAAIASVALPALDNRRKWTPPQEEPEPEASDEQKWDLMQHLGIKFLKKVVAEREARVEGRIVAADFYLRQITMLEVMFDLTASNFGWDAGDVLRQLRRNGETPIRIVSTPFADWLDECRRKYWESQGDPARPEHPPERFVEHHHDGPWGSRGGQGYSTEPTDYCGVLSRPATGFSQEDWFQMTAGEQRLARKAQYAKDAAEQAEWESRARAEHSERTRSDK